MAAPRCDRCRRPGAPYTHRGQRFNRLTACEGERLCDRCAEHHRFDKHNEPVGWAHVPARQYVTPVADLIDGVVWSGLEPRLPLGR